MKNKTIFSTLIAARHYLLFAVAIFMIGCSGDYVPPHESVSKGGFVRFGDETESINFALDLTQSDNPIFEANLVAPGGNVAAYDLSFTLTSPSQSIGPFDLLTLTSFPATLTISAQQLADAAGIPLSELKGALAFSATVTNDEGTSFTADDLTGDLSNPGERQALTFNLSTICPSNLAGAYTASAVGMSTDGCCPNEVTLEEIPVTLTEVSTGNYTISDFSGGLYLAWYAAPYGLGAGEVTGPFIDACGSLNFGTFGGPYGGNPTANITFDEATGVISYTFQNGFGDMGTVVLTPTE